MRIDGEYSPSQSGRLVEKRPLQEVKATAMAGYIPPPLEIKSTMYKSCSLANRKPINGFIGPCVHRQREPHTRLAVQCSECAGPWKDANLPVQAL